MTSSYVDTLNVRLGDRLGFINGTRSPKWKWMWAPEIRYWATRLGRVWVIAQWIPPKMSSAEWNRQFQGTWPYSTKGMYHAMTETALPEGVLPTGDLTQEWIWHIVRQGAKTPWEMYAEVMAGVEVMKERDEREWNEYTQDFVPAFDNWAPGSRGYHVTFGGAKELYEQSTDSLGAFRAVDRRSSVCADVHDSGAGEAGGQPDPAADRGCDSDGEGAVRDEPVRRTA